MRCAPGLLLGLVVALGSMSPAAPPDLTQRKQQARQFFLQAEHHYQRGEYAAALVGYGKAYEVMALPAFLFNMAQCHRKLGQFERALALYEDYLRDAPQAPNRPLVDELMAECRRKLEPQRRVASAARRVAQPDEPSERGGGVAANADRAVRQPPPPPAEVETPVYRTWWFWTAVGGAVAAGVVTGAVLGTRSDGPGLSEGSLGRLDLRRQ